MNQFIDALIYKLPEMEDQIRKDSILKTKTNAEIDAFYLIEEAYGRLLHQYHSKGTHQHHLYEAGNLLVDAATKIIIGYGE